MFEEILEALRAGDIRELGALTTRHFFGPLQSIIPWCTTYYTERLIEQAREAFGDQFWGFWMLGGMSGGGMGFIVDPAIKQEARAELANFQRQAAADPSFGEAAHKLFGNLFPQSGDDTTRPGEDLEALLRENGFDPKQHEAIREDLRKGRLSMANSRLPVTAMIEDVRPGDVTEVVEAVTAADRSVGEAAIRNGEVAVVTLAAGAGSRWTLGAGVVKAINPFCRFQGKHRSFLEVHLAKSRQIGRKTGTTPAHVFTTSYLTHDPIATYLEFEDNYGFDAPLHLSRGKSIGLRMIPMERDLRYAWEELTHQVLDERAQKMRQSVQAALILWAKSAGEGGDYRDNLALQCLHPVGHWYEIPNLLLNGTLLRLLEERPHLRTLLMHNIDTLGANVDPGILGLHRRTGTALSFEVIPRRLDDAGGGLARVDGRVRLVEGLALPREEDELKLSYYNTLTNWIEIDALLATFGLSRNDLADSRKVSAAVRNFARHLPTYITIKDVKKRWGHGQEDVFPVSQFERLWGDMSAVSGLASSFFVVPRGRGKQLKDPAQLDSWLREGSRDYIDSLCDWS
jgi:hypothetical protein